MLIAVLQIKKAIAIQCFLILYSVIIESTETAGILFRTFLKAACSLESIAL